MGLQPPRPAQPEAGQYGTRLASRSRTRAPSVVLGQSAAAFGSHRATRSADAMVTSPRARQKSIQIWTWTLPFIRLGTYHLPRGVTRGTVRLSGRAAVASRPQAS